MLTRDGLTDIIENYAQVVQTKDQKTGRVNRLQVWPRFHQREVVRRLLADVSKAGVGRRYLVQHSAGSGKSNSIAWLAHRLVGLERDGDPVIDSVIVVTDRRVLDKQISDTVRQFEQVSSIVGQAKVLWRPAPVHRVGQEDHHLHRPEVPVHPGRDRERAARPPLRIIIDEAHSSQGGRTSAAVSMALGKDGV